MAKGRPTSIHEDYEVEVRSTDDWYDPASRHGVMGTPFGFVHVRIWHDATLIEFIWQKTMHRRIYARVYDTRWLSRLAWRYAHEIVEQSQGGEHDR